MKYRTTVVISVFDDQTDELIFEADSETVNRDKIRAIIDPKTAPGEILLGGGHNEITKKEADQILAMMGKKYDGPGTIFLSVERIIEPGKPISPK